jgi:hypothetical protein
VASPVGPAGRHEARLHAPGRTGAGRRPAEYSALTDDVWAGGQRGRRAAREGSGRHALDPRPLPRYPAGRPPGRPRPHRRARARGRDGRGAGIALAALAGGERWAGDRRVARAGIRRPAGGGERHPGQGRHARLWPHDLALCSRHAGAARGTGGGGGQVRRHVASARELRRPVCSGDTLDTARGFRGGRRGAISPRGRDGGLRERPPGTAAVPWPGARGRGADAGGATRGVGCAVRRCPRARGPGHRARRRAGDGRPMARQRGRRGRARGRAALDRSGRVPGVALVTTSRCSGEEAFARGLAARRGRVPSVA